MFLSIWSYTVSVRRILFEFSISVLCSIYLIYLAFKSPCPPFIDSWLGPFLTVLAYILSSSLFMRIRCLVSARLERFGKNVLMWFGFFSILGEVVGGIITFIFIEHMRILKEVPECVNDRSYCNK